MTDVLLFLLTALSTLFSFVLLMNAWIFWCRIPAFNPLIMSLNKLSRWLLQPLHKVLPPVGRVDIAALICTWLVQAIYFALVLWVIGFLPLMWHSIPLQASILFIKNITSLITWFTVIYALMSWFSPLSPAMGLLGALLNPLLTPLRKLPGLNRLQGLDFSPVLLLIIAQAISIFVNQYYFFTMR